MSGRIQYSFWSKRNFIGCIGIDYAILENLPKKNYAKFYLTSVLVALIFLTSFASIYYGFDLMFDMWHAEILLSLFFSFMFFNVYIFLIQTFSKEVFPSTIRFGFFNLSNLCRFGFVMMLGFILSQPIKIFLLQDQLDKDVLNYKQQLIHQFKQRNQNLYRTELNELSNYKDELLKSNETPIVKKQLNAINEQFNTIQRRINHQNDIATVEINQSNFFIQRIKLSSHYRLSIYIVLFMVALYCAPVVIIYSISNDHEYYKLKKSKDRKLVIQHYLKYKDLYQQTFKTLYHVNVEFHENYLDPPFNTKQKPLPHYIDQNEFLKMINSYD